MRLESFEITVIVGFLAAFALLAVWAWRSYIKDRQEVAVEQLRSQGEVHPQRTLADFFDGRLVKCLFVAEAIAVAVAFVMVVWILLSGLHYFWTHPLF